MWLVAIVLDSEASKNVCILCLSNNVSWMLCFVAAIW